MHTAHFFARASWASRALVALAATTGCGALAGIDWDRVQGNTNAGDGSIWATDGAADPDVPPPISPHPDGTCDPDRKKCEGLCVSKIDPRYGCDPNACGVCWVPHGAAACRGGQCAVHACDDGWAACGPQPACSTHIATNPDACGACGHACGPTDVCDDGTCASSCTGPRSPCGRSCIDLDSDGDNCGACGATCPGDPNGTASCTYGSCGLSCSPPYVHCGQGCVHESVDACGSSCAKCAAPPGATPYCAASKCQISCGAGLAACKGQCVPESVQQCGDGCTKCSDVNGTPHCAQGSCKIDCEPGTTACTTGCCEPAKAIFADGSISCAVTSRGVRCWGSNDKGLLGAGSNLPSSARPLTVVGLDANTSDIQFGTYTNCAVTGAGGVKCWGQNGGALGTGEYGDSASPVDVKGLTSGVAAVRVGQGFACALLTTGGLKCWGTGYLTGDGSDGNTTRTAPVDVKGAAAGVTSFSLGDFNACIVQSGAAKCWGQQNGVEPVLGTGDISAYNEPTQVVGLTSGIAEVSANFAIACAKKTDGTLVCWGDNEHGQIGNGAPTQAEQTPKAVVGLATPLGSMAVSVGTTCTVSQGGAAQCWGMSENGMVGDGTTTSGDVATPAYVFGLTTGVAKVLIGTLHACALTTARGLVCWGGNNHGQLGNGTTKDSAKPVGVTGLGSGVVAFALGDYHGCALLDGGQVKCWGKNAVGQVGTGDGTSTDDVLVPTEVTGL